MYTSGAYRGTGVMGGCEPPCGFWESNLGPQKASALRHWTKPLDLMVIFGGNCVPGSQNLKELTTVADTW